MISGCDVILSPVILEQTKSLFREEKLVYSSVGYAALQFFVDKPNVIYVNLCDVVTIGVAQIARNFSAEIVAGEGASWERNPTNFQQHIGNGWNRIPL